ncbi:MAG TPA: hypothetical protein VFP25_05915, partial [Nitrososphaeraceae archaeon]|nr:hypothetical protein [Nitrososphaeraceae archaeon]
ITGLPKFDTNNNGSSKEIFIGLSVTAISFSIWCANAFWNGRRKKVVTAKIAMIIEDTKIIYVAVVCFVMDIRYVFKVF